VIVVGDGVIGFAVALAAARDGASVWVIGNQLAGSASSASAGLLAPSIGTGKAGVRDTYTQARDRFPAWTKWLAERTGIDVPLNRGGILEVAANHEEFAALSHGRLATSSVLTSDEVVALAPTLSSSAGGVMHALDGYIDPTRLLEAMREAARCEWAIDLVQGRGARIQWARDGCTVVAEDGRQHEANAIVIAAGAWSALVDGLPRPLPVEPVRGQMLKLRAAPLRFAVSGPDCYLVPRGEATIVGSTLERVGFDYGTTKSALDRLHAVAAALAPGLDRAEVIESWAGLRPMTPDGLPLLGRDPDIPSVVYACGHGKNGILLAPLTGECIAAVLAGTTPPVDLTPFSPERFE
jgi:glycine oxidase